IFAVEFTPENFDASLLEHVVRLPNVMQIQLAGTSVQDADLRKLVDLRLLTGIGLERTSVTDEGISHLRDLPYLQYIECDETSITAEGLDAVVKKIFGPPD
ncbi:MAG: hypothetical protein ABJ208_00895, partial [Rhodopirellula bahusiensis]